MPQPVLVAAIPARPARVGIVAKPTPGTADRAIVLETVTKPPDHTRRSAHGRSTWAFAADPVSGGRLVVLDHVAGRGYRAYAGQRQLQQLDNFRLVAAQQDEQVTIGNTIGV